MTASQWLEVLSSYAVQVGLVVTVAYLLERKADDSHTRSSIWSMLFWSILLLGGVGVLLPRLHLVRPWSTLRPETVLSIAETQALLGKLGITIWCFGAGVTSLRWLNRGYLLQKILVRCERLSEEETQKLLAFHRSRMLSDPSPVILISNEVDGPFCWQLHEPTVVLPRYLLQASEEDLSHVMVHELEHLQTHHPLQLFLQHVVEVVCWFHPAVWTASRHVSLVREFACDDAAVATGANTASYLRTLLRIAERSEANNTTLGFGRNRSEIVVRSRRLVERAMNGVTRDERRLSFFAAMTVMVATTLVVSQLWLPTDALASSRSAWSPWPTWSARSLHSFGISVRDFDRFDHRCVMYELREGREE